jgi:serralysin
MTNVHIYSSADSLTYQDLVSLNFDTITSPSMTASNISGFVGGLFFSIGGAFTYDAYGLNGGTVSAMSITHNGSSLISMTGMSLDVYDIAYSSPSQVERLMFAGSDSIVSDWSTGDIYSTFSGDDRIRLGNGNDTVDGGTGTDTFVLAANFSSQSISIYGQGIRIDSSQGRDTLLNVEIVEFLDKTFSFEVGNASSETLNGDANETALMDYIFGGAGNDRISGGAANDQLFGNSGVDNILGGNGRDLLNGGIGNDQLVGGGGNDRLIGGGGRDTLTGHKGNDLLTGDRGADVFLFHKGHGSDTITDFEIGNDVIQIGRGANRLGQLDFQKQGNDVLVTFANVEILVEDVTIGQLQDVDNFLF